MLAQWLGCVLLSRISTSNITECTLDFPKGPVDYFTCGWLFGTSCYV